MLLSTGIAIPSSSTNEVNATPGPGAYNPYNGNNIGTPRSSRHNEVRIYLIFNIYFNFLFF